MTKQGYTWAILSINPVPSQVNMANPETLETILRECFPDVAYWRNINSMLTLFHVEKTVVAIQMRAFTYLYYFHSFSSKHSLMTLTTTLAD